MAVAKPIFALVDCNNFFVSCERVFRPDLWHKPVAVLSNNDGCIVARSNEVKALGVPMGVPYFKVRDVLKKGDATLFSANFPLYGDFSQRVVQILQQACPDMEVYSVDESFLEISKLPIDDFAAWGRELRQKIYDWTGLPVSVGVAHSKTLAKAAADYCKKNDVGGAFSIVNDDAAREHLLKWMPVGDVWGIGWRTAPKLHGRGIRTAYDLAQVSDAWAREQLSIRGVRTIKELQGGTCYFLEDTTEPQQTILRSRSFGHNVRDYYELEGAVATFASRAASRLRQQNEVASAVMTFLYTGRHAEVSAGGSHVVQLHPTSADTGTIITAALKALEQVYDPDFAYKKAGVALLDLQSVQQLAFNSDPVAMDRQATLMQTVDGINKRFGTRLVRHASEHIESAKWHSKREQRSQAYTTSWRELRTIKA
ncbi:MAG TPA: Y-family DNA polymerase [Candidatus Saccharimonadales bacterium]|nr:Y-family DNA polymerase [Candidatus Saccharimonadales bacterium]